MASHLSPPAVPGGCVLLGSPATHPPASPGSQSGLPVGKGPIDGSRSEAELGPIRQVDGLSAVRGGAHIRPTCCTVRLIRRRLGPSLRYFVTKFANLVSPGWAVDLYTLCSAVMRAFSSVGRALPLQGRCRGFESLNAHKFSFRTPQGSALRVFALRGQDFLPIRPSFAFQFVIRPNGSLDS